MINRIRSTYPRWLGAVVGLMLTMLATAPAKAACPFTDSNWDLTSNALVFSRYAATLAGPPLVANTRFASADPATIKRELDHLRGPLDMNGDAQITSVDSAIVARHTAGFRDAALTTGLSLGAGSRASAAKVLAFIAAGCPAPIGARTPRYEALPYVTERTALIAQMNAQGARGFQYISGLLAGSGFVNLYVKDQNTNFSYQAFETAGTASDLLVQLNGMGARGFRLEGFLASGTYFIHDNTANLSYTYELPPAASTSSSFLSQANDRGGSGFYFVFTYLIGGNTVAIYGKDSSDARYQYELHPSTDVNVSADDFVAQANAQGQRGFKFTTGFFFTDATRNIYVKDMAQSATFTFKATPVASSAAALVSQANSEGQVNFVYFGALIFFPTGYSGPQQPRNIYVYPANCAGWVMCSAGGPF